MKSGSAEADYIYNQVSSPQASARHAMSTTENSPEDAQKLYCKYIRNQLEKYKNQISNARSILAKKAAYAELGRGLHAVMDSTSPAHRGFQQWTGDASKHGPYVKYIHEKTIESKEKIHPYKEETIMKIINYMHGNLGCECS